MESNSFESRIDMAAVHATVNAIRAEVSKVIVGQQHAIDALIVALLAGGHVLIEGVPGVAKTLLVKVLARILDCAFSRIQFTPDLMPSDVLGTSIYHPQRQQFEFTKGPVFSNLILIDEINRAPAKTQAALFEVMEEYQVTYDGITYPMDHPFMVLATQNPIEHEGTYRLPEAQLDRFLFKVLIDYPTPEEEQQILTIHHEKERKVMLDELSALVDKERIQTIQRLCRQVRVEKPLMKYMVDLVGATRDHAQLTYGASPRATVAILNASKAYAMINGRDFVVPDDIQHAALPILRHRVMLTPEQEMEGVGPDEVLTRLLKEIEVPR